jgi:hypothetical protein
MSPKRIDRLIDILSSFQTAQRQVTHLAPFYGELETNSSYLNGDYCWPGSSQWPRTHENPSKQLQTILSQGMPAKYGGISLP